MSKSETDEQAQLDEFQTALEMREDDSDDEERPNWEPGQAEGMDTERWVECPHCENKVSKEFARVFGDNEDRLLNGCPDCATYREISGLDRVGSGVGRGDGW